MSARFAPALLPAPPATSRHLLTRASARHRRDDGRGENISTVISFSIAEKTRHASHDIAHIATRDVGVTTGENISTVISPQPPVWTVGADDKLVTMLQAGTAKMRDFLPLQAMYNVQCVLCNVRNGMYTMEEWAMYSPCTEDARLPPAAGNAQCTMCTHYVMYTMEEWAMCAICSVQRTL